jgi:hypothetical protein
MAVEFANKLSQRSLAVIVDRHALNMKRGEDVNPLPW